MHEWTSNARLIFDAYMRICSVDVDVINVVQFKVNSVFSDSVIKFLYFEVRD